MKVRFNKNKTVSLIGLTEEQYYAIRQIVLSANRTFDEPSTDGEFHSNDDFLCSLTREQIDALDKIDWLL